VLDGDTLHLFGIWDARFDYEGNAVLALSGAGRALLLMDSLGGPEWVAGRRGEGPGEFRAISGFTRPDERTFVWDDPADRMSVFDRNVFVASARPPFQAPAMLVGLLDADRFVFSPGLLGVSPGERRSYEVWEYGSEETDSVVGLVETQSNLATLRLEYDGGGHTVRTDLPGCVQGMLNVAFMGAIYVANVAGQAGRVFVIEPGSGTSRLLYETAIAPEVTNELIEEIRGRFEGLIRTASEPSPGPGGVVAGRTNVRLHQDSVAAIMARVGDAGSPLTSTWTALVMDEESGHLWLRRAQCGSEEAQEWEVVGVEGELVARAVLPPGLVLRDVRFPRMLFTSTDSLGIETVSVADAMGLIPGVGR
jgi:hypothetical protein